MTNSSLERNRKMIELKTETMQNAIAKARAERKNLVVRVTHAIRMYKVESKSSGKTYLVNFFVRNNRRFGHCNCSAGEQGRTLASTWQPQPRLILIWQPRAHHIQPRFTGYAASGNRKIRANALRITPKMRLDTPKTH